MVDRKALKWRFTNADKTEMHNWLAKQDWVVGTLGTQKGIKIRVSDITPRKYKVIRRAGWKFSWSRTNRRTQSEFILEQE